MGLFLQDFDQTHLPNFHALLTLVIGAGRRLACTPPQSPPLLLLLPLFFLNFFLFSHQNILPILSDSYSTLLSWHVETRSYSFYYSTVTPLIHCTALSFFLKLQYRQCPFTNYTQAQKLTATCTHLVYNGNAQFQQFSRFIYQ